MSKAKNQATKSAGNTVPDAASPEATGPAAPPAAAPEGGTEAVAPAPPVTLGAEQYEELRSRASKAEEHWDRLLRTMAEFDNFRKRVAREREETLRYANEGLIGRLIPVLDSLEAALAAAGDGVDPATASLRTGLSMVQQQFKAVLTDAGVQEVDAAGQVFDPKLHEAVSHQEDASVPEGHVLRQLRKGYKLRDRLLRPATVIVAKKPAPAQTAEAS